MATRPRRNSNLLAAQTAGPALAVPKAVAHRIARMAAIALDALGGFAGQAAAPATPVIGFARGPSRNGRCTATATSASTMSAIHIQS